MAEGGPIIVIKGGSVSINFSDSLFQKDPSDPNNHQNLNLKIKRIVITGMNVAEYDTDYHPEGLMASIMVVC